MTHSLTPQNIALGTLVAHPANVRANSPETYDTEAIAGLKASIIAHGLIQPILVQKIGKDWGVLAGGRRHAALAELAADKSVKDYNAKTKINCMVVPDNCDITTALSLAENITQAPMTALDEYEAFARMMQTDGQTPEDIALAFGTTVRAVKDRLRFGLVHPEIRAAARAKEITLDAMKAFANHPSLDVQKDVYDALAKEDGHMGSYTIRNALTSRGIQVSDDIGQFVLEDYKAQDGPITADLLEEHSVLDDAQLVEIILLAKLNAIAEAKAKEMGFAWFDAMPRTDFAALSQYGRVYPEPIEPDAKTQKQLDKIDTELSELEAKMADDDIAQDDYNETYDRAEALEEQQRALQEGYTAHDLAKSGVIASWSGNGVNIQMGFIKPEDMEQAQPSQTTAVEQANSTDGPEKIGYAASLEADLKIERSNALGAALAQNVDATVDLVHYKLVTDAVGCVQSSMALDIRGQRSYDNHSQGEAVDPTPIEQLADIEQSLNMTWAEDGLSPADQFAAFRELPNADKMRLVAFAAALTTRPSMARNRNADSIMHDFEIEIMPDVRAHWRPNGTFFKRLKKQNLLDVLNHDLGLTQEAMNLTTSKKGDIVDFMDKLFTEPFATLTPDQRTAVDHWCPPSMQTTNGFSLEAAHTWTADDKATTADPTDADDLAQMAA